MQMTRHNYRFFGSWYGFHWSKNAQILVPDSHMEQDLAENMLLACLCDKSSRLALSN